MENELTPEQIAMDNAYKEAKKQSLITSLTGAAGFKLGWEASEAYHAAKSEQKKQNGEPEYTEGICGDGAAILKDGVEMTISEILSELNKTKEKQTGEPKTNILALMQLAVHIQQMDKHMAEQFMRNDYRSMWEIWRGVADMVNEIENNLKQKLNGTTNG